MGWQGHQSPARPWVMLGLIAVIQVLGMAAWFAAGAVGPELAARFHLDSSQVAWLTSAVSLGFVAGTLLAAVLNLSDLVPSRWYLATAATLAAGANLALLIAPDYHAALASRFVLGVCLAGVYPPAMKMAATWFVARRGFAIGVVVGSLTIGKALPYLVEALGGLGMPAVIGTTSLAAAGAAALAAVAYRDGPHAFPRRPFSWGLIREVVQAPDLRLVTLGYLGHMWELYAFWTFIGGFWLASQQVAGAPVSPSIVAWLTFASIAVGAIGCVWGGLAADRIGRERVVIRALLASGLAALLAPVVFGRPFLVVLPVVLIWGIAVIADSAQFSALVTERAPSHAVGTALTLQTSLGFLVTMGSIQAVAAGGGPATPWTFPLLAAGPALGIAAMSALVRRPRGQESGPR